ncbi:MAG: RNA-binding S4 domain-containing protein [Clostridia bacterium]|nr:RNA-binding S4 domain-containing protein [Clostridia bacterium]
MRLDKYLKVSRLIKRRTVASDACSASRVSVNGKPAKPAHDVKVGDVLEISLGTAPLKVEVVRIAEHSQKADADSMYRVIE